MPACSPNLVADINHLERMKRLAARLVTDIRHLSYEERLQRLGLHSLQRWRLRVNLITVFKIFKGLLDIDPNLFFLPPARRGHREHPYKVLQGVSHRRRRGSVRVVKYWNKPRASVVTAPSLNIFKKKLENVWRQGFSPSTQFFLTPPPRRHKCTVPTTVYFPKSPFCVCDFFERFVAFFLLL